MLYIIQMTIDPCTFKLIQPASLKQCYIELSQWILGMAPLAQEVYVDLDTKCKEVFDK